MLKIEFIFVKLIKMEHNYFLLPCLFPEICIDNKHIKVKTGISVSETIAYHGRAVIVVEFKYKDKIVSQGFYRTSGKTSGLDFGFFSSGTWFPFDGIKHFEQEGKLAGWIDKEAFSGDTSIKDNKFTRLGDLTLARISFTLGGGMWLADSTINYNDEDKNLKREDIERIKNKIGVPNYLRADMTSLASYDVSAFDVNEFVDESISLNYYPKNNNNYLSYGSSKLKKYREVLKKDKLSALDHAHMHPTGLVYVPKVYVNIRDIEWYQENVYDKLDKLKEKC